nr:ATP-binding protein [uncultured Bacteroides sp.]
MIKYESTNKLCTEEFKTPLQRELDPGVYDHKQILWNEGRLPEDFTIETLLGKHPSEPHNKNIADIFFKVGFIEAWGRGVSKIITGFTQEGLQAPKFEATMGGIMVTIIRKGAKAVTPPVLLDILGTKEKVDKLLDLFRNQHECSSMDIMNAFNLKDIRYVRETYVKPLLEAEILALKYPDVPNHPKQMYLLVMPK